MTTKKSDQPKLLTVRDVAEQLGVHDKTVRREIDRGQLKASRIGTAIRIAPDDVVVYLMQNKA